MSPAKFHGKERENRAINGPRPTPLRIRKSSYAIQKPSLPYSPSSSSVFGLASAPENPNPTADHNHQHHHHRHQQQPVIIYAHSPKVIHTKPRDFMALVQKLTGLSRPDRETRGPGQPRNKGLFSKQVNTIHNETNGDCKVVQHNNESGCVLTDENLGGGGGAVYRSSSSSSSSFSPAFGAVPNQFLADMPLFTPNSATFFFSPRPLYRYGDVLSPLPNMGKSISPSVFRGS
ncbi:hypothetical protein U1Q18_002285 [Sarracenia purpurea var. burkii]